MRNIKKSLHLFAKNVFYFHLGWILMVFLGTITELLYHPYAQIQLGIIVGTFLFQLLGQRHCPLTYLENSLLEKSYPEKVYWDKETYEASFMRHCIKKYLKIDAPKGITTILLILVLVITIIVLLL